MELESPPSSPTHLRLNHLNRNLEDDFSNSSTGETAGIYLGILNLFTTLPQFVGTFISMAVFAIFEPGKHELADQEKEDIQRDGVNAIGVCLFIGAISAIGATWATWKLKFVR